MASSWVFDAGDRDFETAVMARSKEVPVVVDFWAPWCGPCRTLGPLLERLADEHAGSFLLAKVNVDDNPGLAQALQVQSIPMVIALRDGQIVSEFVGALPESAVREFVRRILPSEADFATQEGSAALAAGRLVEAERAFRRALELDPRHGGALVGLAMMLAERGEANEALDLLGRVLSGPAREEADRLAAQIRVRQAGGADIDALHRTVEADPNDLESRFLLGQAHAANKQYEEALQAYLEIVRRDRSFRDEAARKAMLDIFALLGGDHPLTDRYRSDLAKALFR